MLSGEALFPAALYRALQPRIDDLFHPSRAILQSACTCFVSTPQPCLQSCVYEPVPFLVSLLLSNTLPSIKLHNLRICPAFDSVYVILIMPRCKDNFTCSSPPEDIVHDPDITGVGVSSYLQTRQQKAKGNQKGPYWLYSHSWHRRRYRDASLFPGTSTRSRSFSQSRWHN